MYVICAGILPLLIIAAIIRKENGNGRRYPVHTDAEKSAEDEIRQIEKNEADKADARIRELKEEEVRRVSEMKKSFEKNSAAWQEEIFRKVISGNDE